MSYHVERGVLLPCWSTRRCFVLEIEGMITCCYALVVAEILKTLQSEGSALLLNDPWEGHLHWNEILCYKET
jgi:hypothetical protein